ncbi:helix-turn-helix transcriptional regulator, partial [Streptomyces sp. NPDC005322]|uniref:helix-turn-helix domain-containing protein n=1 Tax=Streptomyces sp. NPDC005322 TaxID=3157032 RepID=UPI0033A7BB2E
MGRSEEAERFAEALRGLKDRSGRSYGSLATRLHVSTSTLHRYCNGDAVPADYGPVERFARLCGATPDELIALHRRWILADAARRRASAERGATARRGRPSSSDDGPGAGASPPSAAAHHAVEPGRAVPPSASFDAPDTGALPGDDPGPSASGPGATSKSVATHQHEPGTVADDHPGRPASAYGRDGRDGSGEPPRTATSYEQPIADARSGDRDPLPGRWVPPNGDTDRKAGATDQTSSGGDMAGRTADGEAPSAPSAAAGEAGEAGEAREAG